MWPPPRSERLRAGCLDAVPRVPCASLLVRLLTPEVHKLQRWGPLRMWLGEGPRVVGWEAVANQGLCGKLRRWGAGGRVHACRPCKWRGMLADRCPNTSVDSSTPS